MFERYKEKAIKSVMYAQEESRRLGHSFMGTEMILLGLIEENTGIATDALKCVIDLEVLRNKVFELIGTE